MVESEFLDLAVKAAMDAGVAIMRIYEGPIPVKYKEDESPVTEADIQASAIIENVLEETGIPVLSEENGTIPFGIRKNWNRYWLVDPLDGTREFIRRNGEFTVNIALIENNYPVLGVIYAPARNLLYYGSEGKGAFRQKTDKNGKHFSPEAIKAEKLPAAGEKLIIVASRSHLDEQTEAFINNKTREYGGAEITGAGSSLKMCMVAEGTAHYYPRFGTTMEWDTAAGQAIAEAAGALMVSIPEGTRLSYNKQDLRNPGFLVSAI